MYESFYKFSANPFQLSPDPRFFFGSSGHKRAMSYLRYGLTQGEGFIIITGGVGAGKTTLVRALFDDLARENVVAAQLVTTQLEADDMLRMVAASFGLAHEGSSKAAILKNLETFLFARAREGKRVLLVVDEAQNLPAKSLEELRMLSNFQAGGKALLQSFLLGQEEFRNTIQSEGLEQLRQRIIAAYHLEPLSKEETRGYIEHRLSLVGWRDDPEFDDAVFDVIYQFTKGIPRRINTFCDRLLLYGSLEELHHITLAHVKEVAEELRQETSGGYDSSELYDDEADMALELSPDSVSEPEADYPPRPRHELPARKGKRPVNGLESRLKILEERVDILERALRSYLE